MDHRVELSEAKHLGSMLRLFAAAEILLLAVRLRAQNDTFVLSVY
jgi:hypothetical protein